MKEEKSELPSKKDCNLQKNNVNSQYIPEDLKPQLKWIRKMFNHINSKNIGKR